MAIRMEVWGDYACFSRPEMKTERVSYDVITPSAARGILEAVFWHPGMNWKIDAIHVISPIKFTNVRRNEVKSVISANNVRNVMNGQKKQLFINTQEDIQQRAALLLQDVHYIIDAHFVMTPNASESDNEAKFQEIMKRRLRKGQCYHQPYFGCREFPASFRLYEEIDKVIPNEFAGKTIDFGFMLYDMDYSDHENIKPKFFRAIMIDGRINTKESEVLMI